MLSIKNRQDIFRISIWVIILAGRGDLGDFKEAPALTFGKGHDERRRERQGVF